jgi:hypothetical protein
MTCKQNCYSCSFYRSNADKIKLHNLHIQKTSTFIVQLLYTTQQRNPITIPAEQRHLYAYEIRVINKTHKAYFLLHMFLVLWYNLYFITATVFYLTQGRVILVQILYILHLMDITLKITITAMFVTTDVQTRSHTQSIGIFMIYLPNKLHTHNFSGSLVTVIKSNHITIWHFMALK